MRHGNPKTAAVRDLADVHSAVDVMTLRGEMRINESMARHTSWRVGGPADRYFAPDDEQALDEFLASLPPDEPLTWLGLGSNLLVRDGGIRGTVIVLTRLAERLQQTDDLGITAGAGSACAKVARFSAEAGLSGAEFLAGIPGTLGGALAMNAGAFGTETWSVVDWVETVDRCGRRHRRQSDEFTIGYRSVRGVADEWFMAAGLKLEPDADGGARQRIRELLARRSQSQPMGLPSCGSVFRNPPGDYAGRLIERCGLKGFRIGRAYVSDKHANFIINSGGATAADIEGLIEYVQSAVRLQTGVELEAEVRIIGEPLAKRNGDDRL